MTAQSELITKATAELSLAIEKELKVADPALEKARATLSKAKQSDIIGDLPSADRTVDE